MTYKVNFPASYTRGEVELSDNEYFTLRQSLSDAVPVVNSPLVTASPGGWRGFQFNPSDTPFKRNYNWLWKTFRPQIAIVYAVTPAPNVVNAMTFKRSLDEALGGNYANPLINAMMGEASGSPILKGLGLPDGWHPPKIAVDRDGKTMIIHDGGSSSPQDNGKTVILPEIDEAWLQPKQWWEK